MLTAPFSSSRRWSLPSSESSQCKAYIITLIFRGPFTTWWRIQSHVGMTLVNVLCVLHISSSCSTISTYRFSGNWEFSHGLTERCEGGRIVEKVAGRSKWEMKEAVWTERKKERKRLCHILQSHVLQDPDVVTTSIHKPVILMSLYHRLHCILLANTCVRTIFCFPD